MIDFIKTVLYSFRACMRDFFVTRGCCREGDPQTITITIKYGTSASRLCSADMCEK
jgi:hypothetical protein